MWILLIALFAIPAAACDINCQDMGNGTCACDAPSEKTVSVVPSDEKPRKGSQPEWEIGEVKADMGVRASTAPVAQDYKAEREQK